ncbi:MAG: AAA family ATPase, partial [Dyadobacter sp.]
MDSFINHIEIKNFKSIQHLEIDGLRKINLFIGKPNVGKSNILEALSLFTIPYLKDNPSKKITDLIRLESLSDIFCRWNIEQRSTIMVRDAFDEYVCEINYNVDNENVTFFNYHERKGVEKGTGSVYNHSQYTVNQDMDYSYGELNYAITHIKRYIFRVGVLSTLHEIPFLYPPFGINLFHVLESMPKIREEVASWFKRYNLKFGLGNTFRVQKEEYGKEVFSLPYSSIADTLQRLIFYKTAITSNRDSVLIFEEPEAHAHPPYIMEFTQEVIHSETNQFFMATHSPIVINDFLENAIDDLSIFIVDYKNDQTMLRSLSNEEIHDVYKYGIDLFFNGESYPV